MSRFSKAEAESRGWQIVHEREERVINTAAGEQRTIPASYRAEKYVNEVLINEEGETMGKLLERISLKETQLEAADVPLTEVPVPEDVTLNEEDVEQRTVLVPADPEDPDAGVVKISEAEWSARSRTDVIVQAKEDGEDGEHEVVFYGPRVLAAAADDVREEKEALVANQEEHDQTVVREADETKQVLLDNSGNVDSPGQSGPSRLVVPIEADSVAELQATREQIAADAETRRVIADSEARKGYSENVPDPLTDSDLADVRSEAEEEKAKELRDENPDKPEAPEHAKQVSQAGAEAEQEVADEAEEEQDSDAPEQIAPEEESQSEAAPSGAPDESSESEAAQIMREEFDAQHDTGFVSRDQGGSPVPDPEENRPAASPPESVEERVTTDVRDSSADEEKPAAGDDSGQSTKVSTEPDSPAPAKHPARAPGGRRATSGVKPEADAGPSDGS